LTWSSGWCSYYNFYEQTSIIGGEFDIYFDLVKQSGIFMEINFNDIVIISRPPLFIKRDGNGQLHCPSGPAIEFRDGFTVRAIHGVSFSWNKSPAAEYFNAALSRRELPPEEVLTWQNMQQRAAVIGELGIKNVIDALHPKILDRQVRKQKYTFRDEHGRFTPAGENEYILFETKIGMQNVKAVQVQWFTKQGDFDSNIILVDLADSRIKTALDAVAWTFPMPDGTVLPGEEFFAALEEES